jgi:hypothetical protein
MSTKKKPDPVEVATMDESNDLALIDACTRISASLILKYGVMKPTPTEAQQIADASLFYARAMLEKVRG